MVSVDMPSDLLARLGYIMGDLYRDSIVTGRMEFGKSTPKHLQGCWALQSWANSYRSELNAVFLAVWRSPWCLDWPPKRALIIFIFTFSALARHPHKNLETLARCNVLLVSKLLWDHTNIILGIMLIFWFQAMSFEVCAAAFHSPTVQTAPYHASMVSTKC